MKLWVKNILIIVTVSVLGILIIFNVLKIKSDNISAEEEKTEYVVGLSVHFMQDDYTVNVVNGFEESLAVEGVKTIVVSADGDSKKQVADIEDLINQGVDAIGICPLDDSAVRRSLIKAHNLGIKVVTITEIPGITADAVVYGREYENGYGSGKRLADALSGEEGAEVVILDFPYNVDRIKERIRGFKDALADTDIKITVQWQPVSGTNEEAMDYIKGLLETNPNIKGVFGSYSNQVIGAGAACKALNRKDIVVVGVDADTLILKLIEEGWVLAAAAQFPEEHGRYCGEAILEQLKNGDQKETYTAPYQLVDKENVEQMSKRLWGKEL